MSSDKGEKDKGGKEGGSGEGSSGKGGGEKGKTGGGGDESSSSWGGEGTRYTPPKQGDPKTQVDKTVDIVKKPEPVLTEPPIVKSSASVQPPVQPNANIPTTPTTSIPGVSLPSPHVSTPAAIIGPPVLNPLGPRDRLKENPILESRQRMPPVLRAYGRRPLAAHHKKTHIKVKIRRKLVEAEPDQIKAITAELNKNVTVVDAVSLNKFDNKNGSVYTVDLNPLLLLNSLDDRGLVDFMGALKKMGLIESVHFPEIGDVKKMLKLFEAAKIAGIQDINLDIKDIKLLHKSENAEFLKRYDLLKKLTPSVLEDNFFKNGAKLGLDLPSPTPHERPHP